MPQLTPYHEIILNAVKKGTQAQVDEAMQQGMTGDQILAQVGFPNGMMSSHAPKGMDQPAGSQTAYSRQDQAQLLAGLLATLGQAQPGGQNAQPAQAQQPQAPSVQPLAGSQNVDMANLLSQAPLVPQQNSQPDQTVQDNSTTSPQPFKPQGNFWHTPFQVNPQTGDVIPESILGGLIKSAPEDVLRMAQARALSKTSQGIDQNKLIDDLANFNNTLKQKGLGEYQGTVTADGNIIAHPKASGILQQLDPMAVEAISDKLVSGDIVPSQLPRLQKGQLEAAAILKNPDYSPAQADMDFAANKAGASSFQKNFNNLDSFHRDFNLNADYLLKLSKKFDRSKLPLINRAIIAGAKNISGDPDATRFVQAVNTVANGYARLQNPTLTGQALSDAARSEASNLLSNYQTDAQVQALLDPKNGSMRIDANNRVQAAQQKLDEIKSTYKKGGSSQSSQQLDKNTAMQILQEAGGDKNKAREIAKQRGYQL